MVDWAIEDVGVGPVAQWLLRLGEALRLAEEAVHGGEPCELRGQGARETVAVQVPTRDAWGGRRCSIGWAGTRLR